LLLRVVVVVVEAQVAVAVLVDIEHLCQKVLVVHHQQQNLLLQYL
jgi:hypothetical protein